MSSTWSAPPSLVAIAVTGMHRSGTSLATRAVEMLGVSLGRPEGLLPPGGDNPAGYWENRAIQELDDELLAHLGGSWDEPPVLDDGWQDAPDLDPFAVRAAAVLERDYSAAAASGAIAFKDPRVSLLLPFWRLVVPITTTVVIVRDPDEVAGSLEARNGFGPAESSVLWLRYLLAATRNDPGHLLICHGSFFDDLDATLDRIASHLGRPTPGTDQRAAVRDHLDPRLHHHSATTSRTPAGTGHDANPVLALARQVWNGGRPDLDALDGALADGIARGWIRAPAQATALASARAEAVSFKEQLKRRNEIVKALKNGTTPPPPLPTTPAIAPDACTSDRS